MAVSSGFWLAAVLFLVQYALLAVAQAVWLYDPQYSGADFTLTYLAALRGLQGDSPYIPYLNYYRPPFSLTYIAPLTIFSDLTALAILRVIDAAAYALALPATLFVAVREGVASAVSPRLGALIAVLWFATAIFHHDLYSGQVNGIVLLAMVGSYILWRHQRRAFAGLLLATAVLTKAFPILLAVLWLRKRDYRALAWLAIGIGAGILLPILLFGVEANVDYVRIAPYIAAFAASSFDLNLSPGSVAALVVRGLELPGELVVAVAGRMLSIVAFLAGAMQLSQEIRRPFIALEFAFVLSLLMVGGQLIEYDHVMFVMPGAVIVFLTLVARRLPVTWFVWLGVALELIQLNSLSEYALRFPSATIGYLLLCGLCGKLLVRYRIETQVR